MLNLYIFHISLQSCIESEFIQRLKVIPYIPKERAHSVLCW
jgi:hypothetical protein